MRERTIMILMGLMIAAFIGVTGYYIVSGDYKAPIITVPDKEITFKEGTDRNALLDGVTAMDEKDGDVTDNICIDTIIVNEDAETATVVYAAYDMSNNVAKEKKVVKYIALEKDSVRKTVEKADSKEDTTVKETEKSEEAAAAVVEEDTEATEADEPEEVTQAEEPEDATQSEDSEGAQGAPVLTMAVSEFEIEVNGAFIPRKRVKSITDDKDNANELMSNLVVDGKYDTKKAGTYTLTYYTVDSDGNESNHEKMKLIVKTSGNR